MILLLFASGRREEITRIVTPLRKPESAVVPGAGREHALEILRDTLREDYLEETEATIDHSRHPPSFLDGGHLASRWDSVSV